MAKNSNSIIIPVVLLGGAAAFAIWASTGTKLQKLTVAFRSFTNNIKLNFPTLSVPVNIEITNPNKSAITFQEINCDVLINNVKVTTLKYTTPVVLKANSKTTIKNIIIQTEIFSAIDQALDAITKSITIRMKGYIKADKLSYPVDTTVQTS